MENAIFCVVSLQWIDLEKFDFIEHFLGKFHRSSVTNFKSFFKTFFKKNFFETFLKLILYNSF